MAIVLTGVTPSGTPHLGNYIGAIRPALARQEGQDETLFFIADWHSLVKLQDRQLRGQYVTEIACTWLACGLDPEKTIFYRQSDVPEICELAWILSTVAPKGLLNRAHAYKDQVANNSDANQDADRAITMGLFTYPVLMAADILGFNADQVPVGKDQVQHIEIARDIAARFNHTYGEVFTLPQAIVDESTEVIPGLDGRKMSKSYNNTIPLFAESARLQKLIKKIKTNSLPPEEPKEPEGCPLMQLYQLFATADEVAQIKQRYAQGIGWGEMKQILYTAVDARLKEPRELYNYYHNNPDLVESILQQGARRARERIKPILQQVRALCGLEGV